MSETLEGLCLLGPTAAGKTAMAAAIADRFPVSLISVDSAMVYRGMDIGTAKPDADFLARYPHRLIDIRDPWTPYSAGEFRDDAIVAMRDALAAGRQPLLVGGTFLYVRALQSGLAPLPRADAGIRETLDARAAVLGWPALHGELAEVDPETAARIAPADRQRIQRALEVYLLTGERLSALQRQSSIDVPAVRLHRIALVPEDRAVLHARIETRLAGMIAAGFVDEVRRLRALPQMVGAPGAMRAVGYRQLWAHLDGEITLEEAWRQARVATRRYAKRQLTWLRGEAPEAVIDPLRPDALDRVCRAIEAAGRAGAI